MHSTVRSNPSEIFLRRHVEVNARASSIAKRFPGPLDATLCGCVTSKWKQIQCEKGQEAGVSWPLRLA
jgi:hypothetical protein